MHLRLLSDIEREREGERERESTACSIASNDWSRRRLCCTLLTGVQVEPWPINTDRLGHHKKRPYLRGIHINLSGPCYVDYVNLKIHHLLEQIKILGEYGADPREGWKSRVMKHDISIIKLNISGLPYAGTLFLETRPNFAQSCTHFAQSHSFVRWKQSTLHDKLIGH